MARYKYQGTFKDGNGAVVGASTTSNATDGVVYVYLAGGTTAASVYTASAGGTAVNSVETDDDGHFVFWVDDTDYDNSQKFKISLTHADFETKEYDDLIILPTVFTVDTTAASSGTDGTISSRSANALGECTGFVKIVITGGTTVYVPYWADIEPSA
jgi:hypothetical protein